MVGQGGGGLDLLSSHFPPRTFFYIYISCLTSFIMGGFLGFISCMVVWSLGRASWDDINCEDFIISVLHGQDGLGLLGLV